MVFFRVIILIIFFMIQKNYLLSCPNQPAYYKILKKSQEYYDDNNYLKAIDQYKKIERCEQFNNTEKNLFQYAVSLILYCKENDSMLIDECKNYYKKAIGLLQLSIQMLKPVNAYKKELSIRYFYLATVFLKLNHCQQAKQYYLKSYSINHNQEAYNNYFYLQTVCNN